MVLEHITPDTILVGHALENDFKALKVRLDRRSAPQALAKLRIAGPS
jgi:hypothetical protein